MATIKGIDVIRKVRDMRFDEDSHFLMHHLTYNSTKDETNGLRIVTECRVRAALPKEFSKNIDPDMILPYIDLQNDKVGMCYKPLIRKVAFPPKYELLTVKWYD